MTRLWIGLASLFSLCPPVLRGQEVSLGVEVGGAKTEMASPDAYWGSRLGWIVGASVALSPTPWLAFQAGVRIHEKGAEIPRSFAMRLRYLELPLLAHATFGRATWPLRPLFAVGLAPAWEISCAAQAVPPFIPEAPPPPMRPEDCLGYRTDLWDVGLVAGIGVDVRVGRLRTSLIAQYTRGTHNIASGYAGGYPIHNRSASIIVSASVPVWRGRPSN